MAIPANPTASGIVSEAMRQALGRAATSGEVARGLDVWIPEIHGDVWFGSSSHKLVETTAVVLATKGTQVYDFPSDCDQIIDITVLDGTARDTLQSATASTATLVSSDNANENARIGRELVLLSGTGSGQRRTMLGWTAPQATALSANWSTVPVSTTTYLVADTYTPLSEAVGDAWNAESDRTLLDRPTAYLESGRTYAIRPVPDKIYPLLVRYWIDLQKVDLASTAFTDLLRTWRSLYNQGIFVKTLRDEDDMREPQEFVRYQGMISRVTGKSSQSGFITPHDG